MSNAICQTLRDIYKWKYVQAEASCDKRHLSDYERNLQVKVCTCRGHRMSNATCQTLRDIYR